MNFISVLILISAFLWPVSQSDDRQLKGLSCQAELIVLGEVTEVGAPPDFWSGQFPATQTVGYKVVEVLKGRLDVSRMDLRIFVVQNDLLSDNAKPRLSSQIFSKGKVHVLFLKRPSGGDAERKNAGQTGTYFSASDVYSVMSVTDDLIRSIRQISCEPQG